MIAQKMQKVLCSLSINPDYLEFAIPELKAILHDCPVPHHVLFGEQLQNTKIQHPYDINYKLFKRYPLVVLNVPDFDENKKYFQKACKGSTMVHKMIQLISIAPTYQTLIENADQQLLQKHSRNDEDKVVCDFYSRNRTVVREEQLKKIHGVLADLNVRGQVNFKNAEIRYQLIQRHEWYQHHHLEAPEKTLQELCTNHVATAKFNTKYELNKRIYLGPTSTDNDLAFMMCNQGLVKSGSLVLDPFVGTGGLLIPPSTRGALVCGSDLDIRVLNGYSVGRINKGSPYYHVDKKFEVFTPKINLSFEQYGLQIPNIIRIDSTKLGLKAEGFFDAIITDPPYGIRAMSRSMTKKVEQGTKVQEKVEENENEKSEDSQDETEQVKKEGNEDTEAEMAFKKKRKEKRKILKENRKKRRDMLPEEEKIYKQKLQKKMDKQRIGQWQKYDKGKIESTQRQKIFDALLAVARKYLRKDGRLVFLFPVYEEEQYKGASNIPNHEGFRLIDLSQNKMSRGNARILVTLQRQ